MNKVFDWDSNRTQILSYGGGVNSVAVCVLIAEGKLPRPDYIIIADTGREATSTWDYLDEVIQPYLARLDLRVEIASHDLSTVDLYSHKGKLLLPMYSTQSGKLSKMSTYCSSEWKKLVVRRWLRQRGVSQCDVWIGYTIDEVERTKQSKLKWERRVWPLLDLMLTRGDCLRIIKAAGLPQPPGSSCWMCPHRNNAEWRFLRDCYPEDFARAVELEREVRQNDNHIWLHEDAVSLSRADIERDNKQDLSQCGLGMCMI